MQRKSANQKSKKATIKDFLLKWRSLIIIIAIYSLTLLLTILIYKSDWKVPENLDFTLIISIVLSAIVSILLIACVYFFVQLFLKRKARRGNSASSIDENCLQEYIRGVSTYLGSASDQEFSLYKSVAADIYRHIPQKYWDLVDKIDEDISMDDRISAWKDLKLFVKLLVRDEKELQNR